MNSKIFFWSYVIKNILEFLIASIYAWWLLIQNFNSTLNCPTSSSCELIYQTTCLLRDLEYSCIMPNVQFYFSISMFGFILLIIYLCCNVYTFLWLLNKRLRKLSNFLQFYVKQDETPDISSTAPNSEATNNATKSKSSEESPPISSNPPPVLNVPSVIYCPKIN